jgi:hypothetical protein
MGIRHARIGFTGLDSPRPVSSENDGGAPPRSSRRRGARHAVKLKPFTRRGLDVLFVALNPPEQSNSNGHYFSGDRSAFFKLLQHSGLITKPVDKAFADEKVFGSTEVNYLNASFGVIDLVEDVVETDSGEVPVTADDVKRLLMRIRELKPRFVCVIHSKVRDALNTYGSLHRQLDYGCCGKVLPNCWSEFVLNYFPNGNNIPDADKIRIFRLLRDRLGANL